MSNEYYFPARILQRSAEVPESAEHALRDLIKADLGGVSPYFFPAEISSDRLDSHYTHMLDSTLQNFAAESEAGVSFLDSHVRRRLGLGYTLTGTYEKVNGVTRVVSDIYTVPGIGLGEGSYASTDDFIRAVRARLVRKVSVGFHGGDMICDICGNSFWDWRACKHWPGRKYTIESENGENGEGEEVVSTFGIDDAHLAEVSGVYEGSTPGAMILRAEGMAEAGLLDEKEIRRLEIQYRIKLFADQRVWPAVEAGNNAGIVQENNGEKQRMDELEQIRDILKTTGAEDGSTIPKAVQWLADENARLSKENARLVPLADQGAQYRADTIKDALAEGVRALGTLGKEFPAETYAKMLENAEIGHIKRMRDDWKRQGDIVFVGGRQTVDDEQQAPPPAPSGGVPDAAYKS